MKQVIKGKIIPSPSERGAVLVLVAITFTLFLGFVAIAIDINHLYVVRNELQNAADAGALAGAQALYQDPDGAGPLLPGEEVNVNANAVGKAAGIQNLSDNTTVEINWTTGNVGDVQRGHWSFSNDRFTPLDSLEPVDIWGVPTDELDNMDGSYEYPPGSGNYPENINAVRVVARRNDIEAESFFAKIYGYMGFKLHAEAVAYVGFSGSLGPLEADMPIVVCDISLNNGDCNIGRMINSSDSTTGNTAAWADMAPEDTDDQCGSGTNKTGVSPLISRGCDCAALLADPNTDPDTVCGVNDEQIGGGDWLGANGGMIQTVYDQMKDCYDTNTGGTEPWEMTLPVIRCDGGQIENCAEVISAVTVNMLYMSDNNPIPDEAPYLMTKLGADNFPNWDASENCDFFYQLADETNPFYNAALLENPQHESQSLPDNFQSTVMRYLPGEDYDASIDPWLIDERWKTYDPHDAYTEGMARWDCFAEHFNLINNDGNRAPMAFKSMYFMPDCEYHEPKGTTSDENFGIRAEYPVLVD